MEGRSYFLSINKVMLTKVVLFVLSAALCLLMGQIFFKRIWMGAVFIPLGMTAYRSGMKTIKLKRKLKYEDQFIDFLTSFSFALQAGFSSENAFKAAWSDISGVYERSEFIRHLGLIDKRLGNNERLEACFVEMAEEFGIEDMKEFAYIYEHAGKTGGNIRKIIQKTTDRMKEKHNLKREITTLVSGKRLEARLLSAMPVLIILYLQFSLGGFLDPLYSSGPGVMGMVICAVLYTVSIKWIGKIVDIPV